MTNSKVSAAMLNTAAATDDLDAAVLPIQNHLGITDGGTCGMVMSYDKWTAADKDERIEMLVEWLQAERLDGEAA